MFENFKISELSRYRDRVKYLGSERLGLTNHFELSIVFKLSLRYQSSTVYPSLNFIQWLICFLVYEGEDHTYKFQAPSEDERDEWIQVIHTASYECLKMQLQSLREQIQAKTGRDPITQPPPTEFGMEYETQSQGT